MNNQRFDLTTVTGKYTNEEGQEKNRYHRVGTLFYNAEKDYYSARLESLPMQKAVSAFNVDKKSEFRPCKKLFNASVITGKYTNEEGQEKSRYHNIGVLSINEDGFITLILESLPFPGENGNFNIQFFEKKKKQSTESDS